MWGWCFSPQVFVSLHLYILLTIVWYLRVRNSNYTNGYKVIQTYLCFKILKLIVTTNDLIYVCCLRIKLRYKGIKVFQGVSCIWNLEWRIFCYIFMNLHTQEVALNKRCFTSILRKLLTSDIKKFSLLILKCHLSQIHPCWYSLQQVKTMSDDSSSKGYSVQPISISW